jgi:hypothetical protein
MQMKPRKQVKQLRKKLVKEAKDSPIRKFIEFDVFQNLKPEDADGLLNPDRDGDDIICEKAHELRRMGNLRVYIPYGSNPMEAIRGLTKVIAWISQSPNLITEPWGLEDIADTSGHGRHVNEQFEDVPF